MAQTGKNVLVDYKVESAFNTAPGASGGKRLRLTSSPGLGLVRQLIQSQEVRPDGLTTMARLGARRVDGSYSGEFSAGTYDDILQAVMRGTWASSAQITAATMTNIQVTSTSQITAAGSSWTTQGVRVGDIVYLTNYSTAANNNINLRVTAVTASIITVAGTPLTAGATDTSCELNIRKKLVNATTPTRRTFYIDEYNQDIDLSEVFGGCKFSRVRISGGPNSMAGIEIGVVGASATPLATGTSPYYSSPTEYTTDPLTLVDAKIRFDGAEVTTLTAFDLTMELPTQTLDVIGATVTPDVFDDDLRVSGSLSMLRQDLDNLTHLSQEDELELHVLLEELTGTPKKCMGIFVPRLKLSALNAPLGNPGAMIETVPFTAGLKIAATGYDQTMLSFASSET